MLAMIVFPIREQQNLSMENHPVHNVFFAGKPSLGLPALFGSEPERHSVIGNFCHRRSNLTLHIRTVGKYPFIPLGANILPCESSKGVKKESPSKVFLGIIIQRVITRKECQFLAGVSPVSIDRPIDFMRHAIDVEQCALDFGVGARHRQIGAHAHLTKRSSR